MAGRSIDELLAPEVILRAVTIKKVPNTALSRLMGWALPEVASFNIAGPSGNVVESPLRSSFYDTIRETPRIAHASVPGSPATLVAPQITGKVPYTVPRSHEAIDLKYEDLNQRRQFGAPVTAVDTRGERYLSIQEDYLAKRQANFIEFQTAAMFRGSYTYDQQGDTLRHGFSGGGTTVNFNIPAANLTDLDMLGAGAILAANWSTDTTDIPADLYAINDAFISLTGRGLRHVIISSVGWGYVLNCTIVKAQAGTADKAFLRLERTGEGEFEAVLKAVPWVTFHIIDYRLDDWSGSAYQSSKLVPDTKAIFLVEPDQDWVQYGTCMETVVEGHGGPTSDRYGLYFWTEQTHQPAGRRLYSLLNGLPFLYNPLCVAYGTIA